MRTGWNLSDPSHRCDLWKVVRRDKPLLVIGAVPLAKFRLLQDLSEHRRTSQGERRFQRELHEARQHMRLCAEVYRFQAKENGYYSQELSRGERPRRRR